MLKVLLNIAHDDEHLVAEAEWHRKDSICLIFRGI